MTPSIRQCAAAAGEHREALRQVEGIRKRLWNPDRRLFAHIWDESSGAFERADAWGVGNGWAAAGMPRVIGALPPDMGLDRTRLVGYVRDVVVGCLAHQRRDGLLVNWAS